MSCLWNSPINSMNWEATGISSSEDIIWKRPPATTFKGKYHCNYITEKFKMLNFSKDLLIMFCYMRTSKFFVLLSWSLIIWSRCSTPTAPISFCQIRSLFTPFLSWLLNYIHPSFILANFYLSIHQYLYIYYSFLTYMHFLTL